MAAIWDGNQWTVTDLSGPNLEISEYQFAIDDHDRAIVTWIQSEPLRFNSVKAAIWQEGNWSITTLSQEECIMMKDLYMDLNDINAVVSWICVKETESKINSAIWTP